MLFIAFVQNSPFDHGLIHWLGTRGETSKEFINPTQLDLGVQCTRSSDGKGNANDLLGLKMCESSPSEGMRENYWEVDLGEYAIYPTQYRFLEIFLFSFIHLFIHSSLFNCSMFFFVSLV